MLINDIINICDNIEKRSSWDEYFISLAFLISTRSSCNRLHVGCILVKNNRVISSGYNGFLSKLPHISCIRDNHEIGTVHAEQNALADCARRGVNSENSIAYITHFPCINCCKILLSGGISEIKYYHDYKNDEFVSKLLSESNVLITQLKKIE